MLHVIKRNAWTIVVIRIIIPHVPADCGIIYSFPTHMPPACIQIDCCVVFVQFEASLGPIVALGGDPSPRPIVRPCGSLGGDCTLQMSAEYTPRAPSPVAKTFVMLVVGFERVWTDHWRLLAMVGWPADMVVVCCCLLLSSAVTAVTCFYAKHTDSFT